MEPEDIFLQTILQKLNPVPPAPDPVDRSAEVTSRAGAPVVSRTPVEEPYFPFSQEIDLFPTSQEGVTRVMAPLDQGVYNPGPGGINLWGTGPGGITDIPTLFVEALDEQGNIDWETVAQLAAGPPQSGGGTATTAPLQLPGQDTITGYQPPDVKWETGTYEAAGTNVPSWWRPMVPRNSEDFNRPDAVFTMMMNAMIPYLSPEDQVTVGRQLYTMWGNDFSMYKDLDVDAQISPEQKALGIEGNVADISYFKSPQRASDAVTTLSNLRESTVEGNRWKFGPGYKFLQELMEAFGNVGKTTRADTIQTLGQIDPLLSMTQTGELSPYGPMANMLTNPFFSRFQLTPTTRTESGEYIFGKPSKQLHF